MSEQVDHRIHPEGQVELQSWNIERSKALIHQLIRLVGHHLALRAQVCLKKMGFNKKGGILSLSGTGAPPCSPLGMLR